MLVHYLRYLLGSANAHGIHSPFVYELVTRVIYDRTHFAEYKKVEEMKHRLKTDRSVVHFTEMGAGKPGNRHLIVREIAIKSAVATKYGRLLFRLTRWFQPEVVIELGTSVGISTAWLAYGMGAEGCLHSIEGNKEVADKAWQHLAHEGLHKKVKIHCGSIENCLPSLLPELPKIDMVYFDANHRLAPTLQYFHALLPLAIPGTVFIFDDINWSPEMREAWRIIKEDDRVTLSVDLFQMGLVFFREGIEKQHFSIRY